MISKLKKIKNRIIFGARATSDEYIKFLKNKGVKIGKGAVFYDPVSCTIDLTNPFLLQLGENVRITHGVIILTHDYSWSVISGVYGECLGGVAPVVIGNNVFIGMNTIILKGTEIGDNVIIGANSTVTRDCESNCVYAGNPARKIMSLDDYYKRHREHICRDALRIAYFLKDKDRKTISEALREYEPLWKDSCEETIHHLFRGTGYYEKCLNFYRGGVPPFAGLDDLIEKARDMYEGRKID